MCLEMLMKKRALSLRDIFTIVFAFYLLNTVDLLLYMYCFTLVYFAASFSINLKQVKSNRLTPVP